MSALRPPSLAIDPERAAALRPETPRTFEHQHLYLFGALAEAHGFVKDTESLDTESLDTESLDTESLDTESLDTVSLALWKSRRAESPAPRSVGRGTRLPATCDTPATATCDTLVTSGFPRDS